MGVSPITKTICMVKEPRNDGTFRYHRIPWDLVNVEGGGGGISPMPTPGNFDDVFVAAGTDIVDFINDMYFDEVVDQGDEINEIQWFSSENEFLAYFDHVTSYYITDTNQGGETGYPRT